MTDQETVVPGSQPFQQVGDTLLRDAENRMERIRGMITSFYRQFRAWDNDERSWKLRIIGSEVASLVGTLQGLGGQRRGEEFKERIRNAHRAFEGAGGGFSAYLKYVQKVLVICVSQLDRWRFLFQITPPGEDVVEYIYETSLGSARQNIIRELLRQGTITSPRQVAMLFDYVEMKSKEEPDG